jgi:orotate phosphoribosyltransferase
MAEIPVPETQEITAKAVHEARAYQVRPDHPFIYVSRIISPDYVDIRLLNGRPNQRDVVVEQLLKVVDSTGPDFYAVCGYVTADLTYGGLVADRMRKPYFYVRGSEKGHGKGKLIEGIPEEELAGKVNLHVGDLLTKATSAKDLAKAVREVGSNVQYHVPIFDRLQGGREALAEIGIEVRPTCIMDNSFYQTGIDYGLITREDLAEVRRYREDSGAWARTYLEEHPDFFKRELERPGAIVDGHIRVPDAIEVLTVGYQDLVKEFSEYMRGILYKLGVKDPVPDFGYEP